MTSQKTAEFGSAASSVKPIDSHARFIVVGVIVVAVIRDLFSGDAMAKRLSMIFLVFMIVPAIAPTMGPGIRIDVAVASKEVSGE